MPNPEIRDNRTSQGETHSMPDRIRLDGKVAVVTGAAGVIGTATMRLLAERGARVVAVDRKTQDLQTAIKDLPASAQAFAVSADVTDEAEVAEYVRAAVDKFGTIDVFYNNAGVEGDIAPITKYSLATFRRVIDVNVVGVFLGLKHVLPVMLKQNEGRNPGNAPVPNDRIVERIPARRLGHASEVASIVAFLASDEASYVSGSAYTVDGGRTAA